eukprot:5789210-Pyramimonas_sp.AAC.1
MCTLATVSGWRVLFVSDGDGGLAYNCGRQVSVNIRVRECTPAQVRAVSDATKHQKKRTLGRDTGSYEDFH